MKPRPKHVHTAIAGASLPRHAAGQSPLWVRRRGGARGGYRELAALAVRMSSPSSSLSLRAARLLGGGLANCLLLAGLAGLGGGCPRRSLWPPSSDVSSSASSGSDVSAASAPPLGPQSAMCSSTRPRIPSVSCGSRAR